VTKSFVILWMGQTVSILGSAMTWFAFTIWAWQKTGQPTTLSMVAFFAFLPTVLFTPLAGVFVDRWSRKLVMLLSDAATAVGTLVVLFLYLSSSLEIWHVYIISALAGFFTAFQYPAYIAAVTTMLPKQKYGHAQGMLGLSPAISGIMAPVIAASLLGRIGMQGIMLLDLVTFLFAFATLIFVRIPAPSVSQAGLVSRSNVWREIGVGFTYIRERVGLRDLTILFMVSNFFLAIGATLVAPMILSNTGNSESILASVQSVGAAGGVLGGVVLTFWGGPKRRVHGILLGGAGACIIGVLWLGLGTTFLVWAIGSFFFAFFEPIVEGGNLAIWQTKVEADIQGRVFSARQLLVQIPYLLGIFVAGPLAEYLFGISTMLVLAGVLGGFVFLAGYAVRPVRQVESLLPDQGD
jgi:MFS transporter, DHA3 family, macrolide efflux protein